MKTINILIALLALFLNKKAQNTVEIFEKGSVDTTYVAVNNSDGWQFTNLLLMPVGKDNAFMEMMLKPYNGVDWEKMNLKDNLSIPISSIYQIN